MITGVCFALLYLIFSCLLGWLALLCRASESMGGQAPLFSCALGGR